MMYMHNLEVTGGDGPVSPVLFGDIMVVSVLVNHFGCSKIGGVGCPGEVVMVLLLLLLLWYGISLGPLWMMGWALPSLCMRGLKYQSDLHKYLE